MLFLLHGFCLNAMRDAVSGWTLAIVGWLRAVQLVPRRQAWALIAVTLALAVVSAACGGDDDDGTRTDSATADGFPIHVVDDSGETVTIARAPTRVVALLPSVTDLIIDLGLSDRIIATDEFSLASPEYAELPSVAAAATRSTWRPPLRCSRS